MSLEGFMKSVYENFMKRNPRFEKKSLHGLSSGKRILKFLDQIPEHFKVGPWCVAAYVVIISYISLLVVSFPWVYENYSPVRYYMESESLKGYEWLQSYRLLVGGYGLSVSLLTACFVGIWPFVSYTFITWNLMSLRLISAYLAGAGWGDSFGVIADCLRFPALVGCSVTVTVWWLVLVPLISFLLRNKHEDLEFFLKFNFSPA